MGEFADSKFPSRPSEDGNVSIYIDHSNFWIQGQFTYKTKHKVQGTRHINWIFDIRKVQEILTQHSGLSKKEHDYNVKVNLYGPSSASMGSFWKNSEDPNVNIKTFDRCPRTGREKEVDTNIVADLVEDVTDASYHKTRNEFILLSGDRDFQCSAEKIINRGYNVHLWSWKNGLSSVYRELGKKRKGSVTVHLLDEFLEEIGFKVPTLIVEERVINEESFPVDQSGDSDAITDLIFNIPVFQYPIECPGLSWEELAFTPGLQSTLDNCQDCLAAIMDRLSVAGVATLTYDEYYKDNWNSATHLEIVDGGELDTDSSSSSRDTDPRTDSNSDEATDSDSRDTDDSDGLTLMKQPGKKSDDNLKTPREKSAPHCGRGKDCHKGLTCRFGHTEEEKHYFRTSGYRQFRKVFSCHYTRDCINSADACDHAHNGAERFCATCGDLGHGMRDCPAKIWKIWF
ncbi:hypothetical protein FDECE_17608 [Fusarium decemcellulare]|nr:hypothetical protein FDECE_17608 [Fusarium decemcellulare]